MYKYEMDPTRTVGATERTWEAGWTDGQTGLRTDGRTDRVKPIYPRTTSLFEGYNKRTNNIVIRGLPGDGTLSDTKLVKYVFDDIGCPDIATAGITRLERKRARVTHDHSTQQENDSTEPAPTQAAFVKLLKKILYTIPWIWVCYKYPKRIQTIYIDLLHIAYSLWNGLILCQQILYFMYKCIYRWFGAKEMWLPC